MNLIKTRLFKAITLISLAVSCNAHAEDKLSACVKDRASWSMNAGGDNSLSDKELADITKQCQKAISNANAKKQTVKEVEAK